MRGTCDHRLSQASQIRLAISSDAARIAAMSRDYVEAGLGWGWTPARVAHSIRNRATNVAIAEAEGELAGFGIMKYRDDEAHLLLFAVKPPLRRRGIGTALLHWLEESAVTAGIELIFLEARASNEAARAFYQRHGYRELATLKGYYSGREDAVRIGKDFSSA
ncbi:MAG TPA: ribosomal protein S18-alanine N-acetyltransferase [Rudaea sp.]